MAYIAYPVDLPGPQPGSFAPRDRRAASSLDGPLQQRARQRDVAGARHQCVWVYTPAEMQIWLDWYRDDLADGQYWFSVFLPGYGGLQRPKHVRYLAVQQALLGSGLYRVTATLEMRAYLPPATYYYSQVYPYVAYEEMAVGVATARDAYLLLEPDVPVDVGLALPGDGQLRDITQSWDLGGEPIDTGLAIPGDGVLGSLLISFTQYGSEAMNTGLSQPGSGGALKTVLISYDQYGTEAINSSLAIPGNGSLT